MLHAHSTSYKRRPNSLGTKSIFHTVDLREAEMDPMAEIEREVGHLGLKLSFLGEFPGPVL